MLVQTVIHIEGKVDWVCWRGNGGHWIGICDPLKLTAQADTWFELMESIGETIDSVMKDLLQTGDLYRFLQDHGWKPRNPIPKQLTPEEIADYRFDIPFMPHMAAHGPQNLVYQ